MKTITFYRNVWNADDEEDVLPIYTITVESEIPDEDAVVFAIEKFEKWANVSDWADLAEWYGIA
jgi:hypothetical protein